MFSDGLYGRLKSGKRRLQKQRFAVVGVSGFGGGEEGGKVEAVLLREFARAFFQGVETHLARTLFEGGNGDVAVALGGDVQNASVEAVRQGLHEMREAAVAAPPVGDEDTV